MTAFIVNPGGSEDRRSIQLATRKNTPIRNERRPERPPESLRAAADIWCNEFTKNRLRSLSATYNCVGMVFATRRTWIEPDHVG